MKDKKSERKDEDEDEMLGEWFENFDEGESIPGSDEKSSPESEKDLYSSEDDQSSLESEEGEEKSIPSGGGSRSTDEIPSADEGSDMSIPSVEGEREEDEEVGVEKSEAKEIPEISTEAAGEREIQEKLESDEHAEIYSTKKGDQPFYKARIPDFSSKEREIMSDVRSQAIDEIEVDPRSITSVEEREEVFEGRIKTMLKSRDLPREISDAKLEKMADIIVRDMIGFGLIDMLLEDNKLEDVLVTATDEPVYVYHRDHGMCVTNISFENEEELLHQIEKMARSVGRRIDQQTPLLDATLPDGSRVNATIPPVSPDGPTLSIRKFRENPLTVIDIINYGTLSIDVAAFLWFAVEGMGVKPSNILFAGGTASGKTTTMNAFTAFVPDRERIISIEDTAELHLPHDHWVRLETRPPNVEGKGEITMEDLVKNSLRMRPDRIIVGEVRGPEALTMFTGMNTGHDGALAEGSLVQMADGRLVPVEEICSGLFERNETRIEDGFEYVEVNGPNVKSLNEETLETEDSQIERVWRKKINEKLLKIETSRGKEIILTPDHPIYTANDEWQTINAEDAEKGSFMAIPSNICTSSGQETELGYLAGYVDGDGYVTENMIQVVDGNPQLMDTVTEEIRNHSSHTVTRLNYETFHRGEVWDRALVNSLNEFEETDLGLLDDESLSRYLSGLFDAEGHVNTESLGIELVNKSRDLIGTIPLLLLRFGIQSSIHSQRFDGKGNEGPYSKVSIYGRNNLEKYYDCIGFEDEEKESKLESLLEREGSKGGIIPGIGDILKKERKKENMTQEELGLAIGNSTRSNIRAYETGIRNPRRDKVAKIANVLDSNALEKIAHSEICWEKIESIEEIEYEGYVYDLTLERNHNYIADGMIVHNCMGTIHSNSANETVTRLSENPMDVPEVMIPALDAVVMQQRFHHREKGQVRRVTEISEVTGFEGGQPQLSRIFKWSSKNDELESTGVPSSIKKNISDYSGYGGEEIELEIKRRAAVLEWMKERDIRNVYDVGDVVEEYYKDPEGLLERIESGSIDLDQNLYTGGSENA